MEGHACFLSYQSHLHLMKLKFLAELPYELSRIPIALVQNPGQIVPKVV